jgi:DNA-binding MarR family transcriptional regulator
MRSKASGVPPLDELPKLDDHLCFALYAAGNHMTRLFVPFLKKLDVTYPQYLVLVVLWDRNGLSVGELATTLLMDLGSLSSMLKRMEKKGLVERRRDPGDERRVVVSLSAQGSALRERTKQMLGEFYCFLSVPVDELSDLRDRLHYFTAFAGASAIDAAAPPAARSAHA